MLLLPSHLGMKSMNMITWKFWSEQSVCWIVIIIIVICLDYESKLVGSMRVAGPSSQSGITWWKWWILNFEISIGQKNQVWLAKAWFQVIKVIKLWTSSIRCCPWSTNIQEYKLHIIIQPVFLGVLWFAILLLWLLSKPQNSTYTCPVVLMTRQEHWNQVVNCRSTFIMRLVLGIRENAGRSFFVTLSVILFKTSMTRWSFKAPLLFRTTMMKVCMSSMSPWTDITLR